MTRPSPLSKNRSDGAAAVPMFHTGSSSSRGSAAHSDTGATAVCYSAPVGRLLYAVERRCAAAAPSAGTAAVEPPGRAARTGGTAARARRNDRGRETVPAANRPPVRRNPGASSLLLRGGAVPGALGPPTRYAEPPGAAHRRADRWAAPADPNAPEVPSVATFDAKRADRLVTGAAGRVTRWNATGPGTLYVEPTQGPAVPASDRIRVAGSGRLDVHGNPGVPGLGLTVVFRALNAVQYPYDPALGPSLGLQVVPIGGADALTVAFGPTGLRVFLAHGGTIVDLFHAPVVPDTTGGTLYTLALFAADRSATVVLHAWTAGGGNVRQTTQQVVPFTAVASDYALPPAAGARVSLLAFMLDAHALQVHRAQPSAAVWRPAVDVLDADYRVAPAVEPPPPPELPVAAFDAGHADALALDRTGPSPVVLRWNADAPVGTAVYAEPTAGSAGYTGGRVRWTSSGTNRLVFHGHALLPRTGLAVVLRPLNAARQPSDGAPTLVRLGVGTQDGAARLDCALAPNGLSLHLMRSGGGGSTTELLRNAAVVPDPTGGTLYVLGVFVDARTTTVVLHRRPASGVAPAPVQTTVDVKTLTGYEWPAAGVLAELSVEGSTVDLYRARMHRGVSNAAAWQTAVAALDAGLPPEEPWDLPVAVFDGQRTSGVTFSGTLVTQWNADAPVGDAVRIQRTQGSAVLAQGCVRLSAEETELRVGDDLPMPSLGVSLVVRPRNPAQQADGTTVSPAVCVCLHPGDGASGLDVTLGPAGLDVRLRGEAVVNLCHVDLIVDVTGDTLYTLGFLPEASTALVSLHRRLRTGTELEPIKRVVALTGWALPAATTGYVTVVGSMIDVHRVDVHRAVNDAGAWADAVAVLYSDVPSTEPWDLPVAVFDAARKDTMTNPIGSNDFEILGWSPISAIGTDVCVSVTAGAPCSVPLRLRCETGAEILRIDTDLPMPLLGVSSVFCARDVAAHAYDTAEDPALGLWVHTQDDLAVFKVEFGPTGVRVRLVRPDHTAELLTWVLAPDTTGHTVYTLGLLVEARMATVVLHCRKYDGSAPTTLQNTVNVYAQTGYEMPSTVGFATVRPSMVDVFGLQVHRAVHDAARWKTDVSSMDGDVHVDSVIVFDARQPASMVFDPLVPGKVLRWNAESPMGPNLYLYDGDMTLHTVGVPGMEVIGAYTPYYIERYRTGITFVFSTHSTAQYPVGTTMNPYVAVGLSSYAGEGPKRIELQMYQNSVNTHITKMNYDQSIVGSHPIPVYPFGGVMYTVGLFIQAHTAVMLIMGPNATGSGRTTTTKPVEIRTDSGGDLQNWYSTVCVDAEQANIHEVKIQTSINNVDQWLSDAAAMDAEWAAAA